MKKLLLPLAILFTLSACGQSSHLDTYYTHYHSDGGDGILSSFMLNLQFSPSNQSKENWLKKISFVRCWSIDSSNSKATEEWKALDHSLKADHFDEWFSARKGKSKIALLSRDGKGSLEDVVCEIQGDNGGGLCFHIRGRFSPQDRAAMERAFQDKDSD